MSLHLINMSFKRPSIPGDFCVFSLDIYSFISSSLKFVSNSSKIESGSW